MTSQRQNPLPRTAYADLLESLLPQAGGYARSILRSTQDAEDAVQAAAMRGLERLGSYDASRSFKAWWMTILRNCCMDILRARTARPTAAEPVETLPARMEGPTSWEELSEALARLAPVHEEILRLRYFGEMSYRELAQALGIPEGTVMSRLHHARKALAAELKGIDL